MCLVDMGFNLGIPRLMKFKKMWEAIERQDFEWAAAEMLNSRWAKQVGKRADNLSKTMEHGEWVD
jgi:lysozyme